MATVPAKRPSTTAAKTTAASAKKGKSLVTPIFRMSFPNFKEPRQAMGEGEAKYGVTAVWEPSKFSPKDKARWQAMLALANETSMAKFKKTIKDLPDNFKKPIRKGEEKEGLDGFGAGKVFANLTTKFQPGLADKEGKSGTIGPDDFYPGCYGRATITCYSYENKGKGVAFGLMNVQFLADGKRLDSRTDASEDFSEEEIDPADQAWLEEMDGSAEDASGEEDDGGF